MGVTTGGEPIQQADLTACDREPIHIPGSIQPHGVLLVVDPASRAIVAAAGDVEGVLAPDWLGADLVALIGDGIRDAIAALPAGPGATMVAPPVDVAGGRHDVTIHRSGEWLLVELEPADAAPRSGGELLGWLDATGTGFERAGDLAALCGRAAMAFRALTGFDRVMIYRFVDEDAGRVVAEDRNPDLGTFLHHHFPATDIPVQARALYVRNRARTIPRIDYTPAPLRPAGFATVDLSDVALRSVSPIHIQYLRNMGVQASASISIVKDGVLWGLVACHHHSPRRMPRDIRATAVVLAGALARQVRAREEAESYRERLRLRAAEDAVVPRLDGEGDLRRTVMGVAADLQAMLGGDGLAIVERDRVSHRGTCPSEPAIRLLADWARRPGAGEVVATHHLTGLLPEAAAFAAQASGVLALPLLDSDATLLWFRVEQVQEVEWAGNPHKAVQHDPDAMLTPRSSFETWTQAVHGRSRRWSLEEVEAAHRLRRILHDLRQAAELRRLNREMQRTLADRDALLVQKDVLMKEVDHRVQNSLQLVSAFLSLQAREAGDAAVSAQLKEAQARLQAVALVHRRLYRDGQVQSIDLARYIEELAGDMKASLGADWGRLMRVDVAPVLMPTDRAISLGLIMTELVINATKYAYDGAPGPIEIVLEQYRDRVRLIVADQGRGKTGDNVGFGSRMLTAMVDRLGGTMDLTDGQPGLRAILSAPIQERPL